MKTKNHLLRLALAPIALVVSVCFIQTAQAAGWVRTGSLNNSRVWHTATLLANGRVLVAGGGYGDYLGSAELYDPARGTWTTTPSLNTGRSYHTATFLPNGKVLVAGGCNISTYL